MAWWKKKGVRRVHVVELSVELEQAEEDVTSKPDKPDHRTGANLPDAGVADSPYWMETPIGLSSIADEAEDPRRQEIRQGLQSEAAADDGFLTVGADASTEKLEDALKHGFVRLQIIKVVLMGVAGAGKTHVKYLLLGENPPVLRVSTALAEAPIRAISHAVIGQIRETTKWFRVSDDDVKELLAKALKAGVPLEQEEDSQSTRQKAKKQVKKQNKKVKNWFRNRVMRQARTPVFDQEECEVSESSDAEDEKKESSAHGDLVRLVEIAQGSKRFLQIQWIHFIDSGGQPEFHEVLPAFIHNAAFIMHVLNLTERLDQHPMIAYYNSSGKEYGTGYLSSLTNDQILQSCVRTMQGQVAKGSKSVRTMQGQVAKGSKPRIIIVGTHLDHASRFTETEAEKNEQLLKTLNVPTLQDHLVYSDIGENKLIFSVNAKTPQSSDNKTAERLRKVITNQEFAPSPIKIPVAWFLLEMDISKLAAELRRGIVSLDQCRECAHLLSIDDDGLNAALGYFDNVNIFLYKPSLLPNVIFCDPQVPLDKVTELVAYSYELRHTSVTADGKWLRFLNEGVITMEMLYSEKFSQHYVPGLFSRVDLLALFRGLLIAVQLHDDEFFMPALLPTIPALKIPKHCSPLTSSTSPLLIFFDEIGCSLKGVFSSLVVFLLDQCKWRISYMSSSPTCLYRDCIELEHSDRISIVTLIDSFKYFEVHLDTVDPAVAASLKQTLLQGLKAAAVALHYSTDLHTIAFFCESPDPTCSSSPHPARVDPTQRFQVCSVNNRVRKPLNDRQLIWLGSNSKDTAVHSKEGPESTPGLLELTNFVGRARLINISEEIGIEYCMVGIALLEDTTGVKVSAIESQYQRNAERISLDILTQWVLGKGMRDRTWRGLVGVLKRSKRVALAEEIEEVIGKC